MKNVIGLCQLCLEEKSLVKSHIYSKFLYKALGNEKRKFVRITAKKKSVDINMHAQDGLWDMNILCSDCEHHLDHNYESPIASVYYEHKGNPGNVGIRKLDNYTGVFVNFDFQVFSKFLLTQLWRMSVSKLSYFRGVSLGPKHTENIRLILFENRPIVGTEYPIVIMLMSTAAGRGSMEIAKKLKAKGLTFYEFKIHQFCYWIYVNSHPLPSNLKQGIITQDNFKFYKAPDSVNKNFIDTMIRTINQKNNPKR